MKIRRKRSNSSKCWLFLLTPLELKIARTRRNILSEFIFKDPKGPPSRYFSDTVLLYSMPDTLPTQERMRKFINVLAEDLPNDEDQNIMIWWLSSHLETTDTTLLVDIPDEEFMCGDLWCIMAGFNLGGGYSVVWWYFSFAFAGPIINGSGLVRHEAYYQFMKMRAIRNYTHSSNWGINWCFKGAKITNRICLSRVAERQISHSRFLAIKRGFSKHQL